MYRGGFELVGDAEEARLLAALNRRPSKLTWRPRYNKEVPSDTGICSPYGWLEVRGVGGFKVYRNDEPLCPTTCRVQPGWERRTAGPPCLSAVPQPRRRPSCSMAHG